MVESINADTAARVRAIVAEIATRDLTALTADSRLVEDLLLDSVALIELTVALEVEFDLSAIDPTETQSIKTLGQLEGFVVDRISGAKR